MDIHKKYSLIKEHQKHFELHDSTDNKTFNIAKKDLHPANQIRLMKMQKYAEGGKVSDNPPPMPPPQKAREAWEGAQHGEMNRLKSLLGLGEPVKKYADGGDIVPDYRNTPADQLRYNEQEPEKPLAIRAGEFAGELGSKILQKKIFDPMAGVGHAIVNGVGALSGPVSQFVSGLGSGAGVMPQASAEPVLGPAASDQPMPAAGAASSPGEAPPATKPMDTGANGAPTLEGLQKLEGQYTAAGEKEVKAQAAQDKDVAEYQQIHQWAMQNKQKLFDEKMADIDNNLNQITQDIASTKIDPNRYWNNKESGNKIGAILGVMLGGIGAGLQHSTVNAGWEAIQKNIDRDIQSQKDDLGKKQTLLSDNLRIQGNITSAENTARLQMEAMAQGQMKLIAAKTNNPILQQQVAQNNINRQIQTFPIKSQLAQAHATSVANQQLKTVLQGRDLTNVDPSTLVEMVVPEHNRKKVYDEIQAAQNTRHMAGNILEAFEQAVKDTSGLGAVVSTVKKPRSVLALHQHMQPTFADLEGTVRQAAMDNTFENITPTGADTSRDTATKRKALEQYLQSKASAPTARGSGLDLSKFNSTRPLAASEPSQGAPERKKDKYGILHEKVRGGWVPVK